ncbi:MAG: T9SS type A sorting domain-containing protein, partial [Ignavibacteriales bacterium]|nr:T9SS type A sorting domain-containing protein [Ignavibacteriales bacterium]
DPLSLPVYEKDWSQLVVSDYAGNSSTLYLTKKTGNLSAFELPPPPPDEIFDIRFSSNSSVECLDNGQKEILLSGVTYPVILHSIGSNFVIKDKATSGKLLNRVLKTNKSLTIYDERIKVLEVSVHELPTKYALMQNYPNPFNPETKITYSLPEKAFVTLTVYNQLGEKVATLAHQDMDAGTHSISWNAGNINSGIYFYEIKAGTFKSVKKLMLLK